MTAGASSGPRLAPRTRSAGVKPLKPPNQAAARARSSAVPDQSFSMRSSISACRRRTLRARGCSTCPPPRVCVADEPRMTNGWPQTAITGSSRKTCARAHAPGATASLSSSDSVPMTSAVPMWKRMGARCLIGRLTSARQWSRTVSVRDGTR